MSMTLIDQDRPHIDYTAFHPIVFFICQECVDERHKAKTDPAGSLILPSADGSTRQARDVAAWESHKRMNTNLEAFMHYMITTDRKKEIYFDTW